MFRPEMLSLEKKGEAISYEGEIVGQQFLGNTYEILLNMQGKRWVVQASKKQQGRTLSIYINKENIKTFEERKTL